MRLLTAAALVLLGSTPALAQMPNPYTMPPGPPTPCAVYVVTPTCSVTGLEYDYDFGNVFLAVEGYEQTFVTLKNKADAYAKVVLEVTVSGFPPVRRVMTLAPQQRPDPVKLNDWAELKDVHTGVSVVVYASERLSVTASMHPGFGPTMWTGARVLEGQPGERTP